MGSREFDFDSEDARRLLTRWTKNRREEQDKITDCKIASNVGKSTLLTNRILGERSA